MALVRIIKRDVAIAYEGRTLVHGDTVDVNPDEFGELLVKQGIAEVIEVPKAKPAAAKRATADQTKKETR